MNMAKELAELLESTAQRLGTDLQEDVLAIREYASERMLHLSTCVDQPGYDQALIAERDSVALFAGISAVHVADAADRELLGIVAGALAIGARTLASI